MAISSSSCVVVCSDLIGNSPATATLSDILTNGGFATTPKNTFFSGPISGVDAIPAFRTVAVADVPTLNQNTTGSAATLTTPRAINGVNFDGSAAITVTAAAGTLTGSSLASGVTGSSLTSVGTLTGGATGAGFTVALTTSTITGTLPAAQFPALTGDVTTVSGALATTIASGVVTLAKMANMATASILGRNTAGTGAPEVLTPATTKSILSLNNVENTALSTWAGSANLTTVGALTGTSFAATGALTSSGTAGIGYATGSGAAVTQATSKSTGVTSNTITTAITMNAASLATLAIVSFTFTNSRIAATDQVIVTHQSAGTSAAYTFNAFPAAGSAVISVRNNTAGALAEAIVLRVSVYKAVSA